MSKSDIEITEMFYQKAKELGASIQTFECPCGYENKTLAPENESEIWDSMTFCPKCEKAYFKTVTNTNLEVSEL